MKLIKDGRIIDATEKAYRVIFKDKGYVPYVHVGNDSNDEIQYDEITKGEIITKLSELGIEHNPRDKKQALFNLLGSVYL